MVDATPWPSLGARRPRPDGGYWWETIVHGPVRSRRLGTSLGINLLPRRSKLCTFDCPYCECGWSTPKADHARWPSPDEVAHSLRRALARLPRSPDWITVAGHGEPTLHPRFAVAVERVLAVRDELAPRLRVGILSNGLAAGTPSVRSALLRLDARMMKLDPGPTARVNGTEYDGARLADDYRALKPYTAQAMVTRTDQWDGSSAASLAAWLPLLARADPDAVHLYSLARPPMRRAETSRGSASKRWLPPSGERSRGVKSTCSNGGDAPASAWPCPAWLSGGWPWAAFSPWLWLWVARASLSSSPWAGRASCASGPRPASAWAPP